MDDFGWARASLLYPASVLLGAGLAFLAVPEAVLSLLGSTGSYEVAFVRLTGTFMSVLGVFVVQIIRFDLQPVIISTIWLRLFIGASLIMLFAQTGDRFFLAVVAILSVGVVLTLLGFLMDGTGEAT